MDNLIFLLITLLLISVVFNNKISNKIILFYVILLPFRFELISLNGVDIRITDFISFLIIIRFFLKRIFYPIGIIYKKDSFSNFILFFSAVITISFFLNLIKFGYLGNVIDLFRILFVLLLSYTVYFDLNLKNINQILIYWVYTSTLTVLASIFNLYQFGLSLNIFLYINDLSVQDFYFLKFITSTFFEDPNNLASYLLLSLFISLHLSFKINKLFFFTAFLNFLGIMISLSRSAYLAITFFILFNFLFLVIFKKRFNLIKTILFFSSLIFTYFFIFNTSNDNSALSRLELWGVGVRMLFDNFLFGVGIGNSKFLFSNYVIGNLIIYNPYFHNLYLNIASELGIISLFSFVYFIFKLIKIDIFFTNYLNHFLVGGLISFLIQSTAVEYTASRHFWFYFTIISIINLNYGENFYD